MGNNIHSSLPTSTQQWITIADTPSDQPGNPQLVRESTSKTVADRYDISFEGNLDCQLNFLQKRKQSQKSHLPLMLDAKITAKPLLDCSDRQNLEIYLERICCRMNQFQATDLELLVVLKQAVAGFQNLQALAANYFVVTEKMIGFNWQGETKVWLNQNFGCLDIEQERLVRSEAEMVKSITDLLQKRLEHPYSWLAQDCFKVLLAVLENVLKNTNHVEIHRLISQKVRLGHIRRGSFALKTERYNKNNAIDMANSPEKIKAVINKPQSREIPSQNSPIPTYDTNNPSKYSLIENGIVGRTSPNQQIQGVSKLTTTPSHQPAPFQYHINPFMSDQQNQLALSNGPPINVSPFHNGQTHAYPSQNVYAETHVSQNQPYAPLKVNCLWANNQNGKINEPTQSELTVQAKFNKTSMLRPPNRLFSSILEQSEEWDESIASESGQSKQFLEKDANLTLFEEQHRGKHDSIPQHPLSKQAKEQISTTSIL